MDTIEFLIAYNRMCDTYHYCDGCPLEKSKGCKLEVTSIGWNNEESCFEKKQS
ncbi:MAG: hypothetical protein MJ236_04740 [Clostridia bacterium]|nr:hypothetical protein [Clostridia bacterium]